ncbi:hypothetical protein DEJ23_10600 [Curtobacterium sp. MCSS17_008]|uniref:Lsr2 dimerization domain-containing protein n=1 Tax=Curtobacterium sp. MCSS17_008 TaxID=2175647 RepID=UPI000DA9A028|nr:hypothetical protein DEJ23_10600 [Curtobacterium sp. MCSS17_008]
MSLTQKLITTLVADLPCETIGPGSGKTVQFGVDGSVYEMDLTNENAEKLREAYADQVAAPRESRA